MTAKITKPWSASDVPPCDDIVGLQKENLIIPSGDVWNNLLDNIQELLYPQWDELKKSEHLIPYISMERMDDLHHSVKIEGLVHFLVDIHNAHGAYAFTKAVVGLTANTDGREKSLQRMQSSIYNHLFFGYISIARAKENNNSFVEETFIDRVPQVLLTLEEIRTHTWLDLVQSCIRPIYTFREEISDELDHLYRPEFVRSWGHITWVNKLFTITAKRRQIRELGKIIVYLNIASAIRIIKNSPYADQFFDDEMNQEMNIPSTKKATDAPYLPPLNIMEEEWIELCETINRIADDFKDLTKMHMVGFFFEADMDSWDNLDWTKTLLKKCALDYSHRDAFLALGKSLVRNDVRAAINTIKVSSYANRFFL